MIDWNGWRNKYNNLTIKESAEFHNYVQQAYPIQNDWVADLTDHFFTSLKDESLSVLEFGPWDGAAAFHSLNKFDNIKQWIGYDICENAIVNGYKHNRYTPVVTVDKWFWELDLPKFNVFYTSHALEHVSSVQAELIIRNLPNTVKYCYVDIPLKPDATNWHNDTSMHIYDRSLEELIRVFNSCGFFQYFEKERDYYYKYKVRFFKR